MKLKTITFRSHEFNLPPHGRFGVAIRNTLFSIMFSPGISLYEAMGLRGKAKSYMGRYKNAFCRFAEVNQDKLEPGSVGPRGGWGYRFKENAK